MAEMEEYNEPSFNWAAAKDYQDDYKYDKMKVDSYNTSLKTLDNFGIEEYRTSLRYGLERGFVYTDEEKAELYKRFVEKITDYRSREDYLTSDGYFKKFYVDPNNPYLEESDVVTRDTAYTRLALAAQTFGFTVIHEEDKDRQKTEGEQVLVIPKPIVEVDVALPEEESTQKPSEQ